MMIIIIINLLGNVVIESSVTIHGTLINSFSSYCNIREFFIE